MHPSQSHWPALDGLRAVAVAVVMLAHVHLVYNGGLGVDIFFVLSGFLITVILSREGGVNLRNFYARRLLRLAPALVVACCLFAVLWRITFGVFPWPEIALTLAYSANWTRAAGYDMQWLGHCWSLSCEEQFYMVWPLAIIALEKATRNNTAKAVILATAAIALAGYRFAMAAHWPLARIYNGLDTHMDGLVMGAALAYAYRMPIAAKIGRFAAPLAVLGLAFFLAKDISDILVCKWVLLLSACAGAAIIAHLVTSPESVMAKALAWSPLVYIGRISYGLYLYHYPIFLFIETHAPGLNVWAATFLKVGISIGAAAVSFALIETPFLRMKGRFAPSPLPARRYRSAPYSVQEQPVL